MCSPDVVRCFKCFQDFSKSEFEEKCAECGDFKCPRCGACLCNLTPGEQRVVLAMIYTYERTFGSGYDFGRHARIEKQVLADLAAT